VPPDRWPEVVERARGESLRALARTYGVSHNAIRTVLVTTDHAHLLNDEGRRQHLASQVPLPPPAAPKIPTERHSEVVVLCQRHTQAEVAALLGVSQATVWRIVQREKKRSGLGAGGPRSLSELRWGFGYS
jgi:Homeodomain-like domain